MVYFPLVMDCIEKDASKNSSLPNNDKGIHRRTHSTILLGLHVFVSVGTCLPSRSKAVIGGIHFTEPLHSKNRRNKHTD
jgi:hypothetical protein